MSYKIQIKKMKVIVFDCASKEDAINRGVIAYGFNKDDIVSIEIRQ